MNLRYIFIFVVIFSCFSCEKEDVEIVTAETIYNDLLGDWEVNYRFEHIADGVVDPDRGFTRDWKFSFSENNTLTIFDDPIYNPSSTKIRDVFITESLDKIILISEELENISSIADSEIRSVSIYTVLEKSIDTQVWESISTFENAEMQEIKWHVTLNLSRE